MIHHPPDSFLVARDLPGRKHHDIVTLELYVTMVVDRDPRKRRLRLTLRAGADTDDILGRIVADVAVPDLHAGRNPQVAEPLRDLGVLDDPATDERDPPIELEREVQHDLHPIDARRKHRHHDASLRAREDLLEAIDDVAFGAAHPLALDVRAVAEQHQHTLGAQLRETMEVHVLAIERRLINLEIPRVQHDTRRRRNRERNAVGHAVRDAQELDREAPDLHAIARPHGTQAQARIVFFFRQLRVDERERQRRSVNRTIDVWQDVRHRADMVLVPVRQH